MKHPLPPVYAQEINRLGQYRTLRDEVAYEYSSSKFEGSNRAMLRMVLTLHPREKGYGGTVSFVQQGERAVDPVAAPLAQGLWQALSAFRLINFALVVQEVEVAVSGRADHLLTELAARAVRHALHDASLQTHDVPGWQPPPEEVSEEELEEDEGPSGAETRAQRDAKRQRRRERGEDPYRSPGATEGRPSRDRRWARGGARNEGRSRRGGDQARGRERREDDRPRGGTRRDGDRERGRQSSARDRDRPSDRGERRPRSDNRREERDRKE